MSPPDFTDPHLPQRLRAQAFIRDGEQRVGRAWYRSMTRFLDRVRPAVLAGDRIDPGRVSDYQGFWTDQVDVEVLPTIRTVLTDAWRRVTGAGSPASDPWTSTYLNDAGNRLRNVPDEVYALIVRETEQGIQEGWSIDRLQQQIQLILTASGTDRWPNRARTVARTETIAAVNSGVYRGAVLEAEQRGDPAPFKQWISTEDRRTRPTHVEADKQRTLLTSPFVVGGSPLLFPGDPRGPAAEVINCRCSLLPVVLGETIDWTDRGRA